MCSADECSWIFLYDTGSPTVIHFILFARSHFVCSVVLIILALPNYFPANLHADESGDRGALRRSDACFPRCSERWDGLFCLVNVRLWNTGTDTHRPELCIRVRGERRQQNHWSVIYIPQHSEGDRRGLSVNAMMNLQRGLGARDEGKKDACGYMGERRGREWQ